MSTKHKHAAVIHAWADGATVQYRTNAEHNWSDSKEPSFFDEVEYRIKPELEPDVVKFANIYKTCVGSFHRTLDEANRGADPESIGVLKITINGETGNVSAEVV